jgi:hypothetical protein
MTAGCHFCKFHVKYASCNENDHEYASAAIDEMVG